MKTGQRVVRLNWGCGRDPAPGWINADRARARGVDLIGDIREGLDLEDDSVDYISSQHALQEIPFEDLVGVLEEMRRVLRPGGVLRVGVPDLDKGIEAYRTGMLATVRSLMKTRRRWAGSSSCTFSGKDTRASCSRTSS